MGSSHQRNARQLVSFDEPALHLACIRHLLLRWVLMRIVIPNSTSSGSRRDSPDMVSAWFRYPTRRSVDHCHHIGTAILIALSNRRERKPCNRSHTTNTLSGACTVRRTRHRAHICTPEKSPYTSLVLPIRCVRRHALGSAMPEVASVSCSLSWNVACSMVGTDDAWVMRS